MKDGYSLQSTANYLTKAYEAAARISLGVEKSDRRKLIGIHMV